MSLFLLNPWGLLGLLGLPAVLAIHLLRRKSRKVVVSTLFLVDQAAPSSEGGRRLRWLRNSLPLWLQLLAVIAATLLLSQPRWIDASSTQAVVAVLDSTASMSAFRDKALTSMKAEFEKRAPNASNTRWVVLGSDASRLATGGDLATVCAEAARNWTPILGGREPGEAFRLARTLAGEKGGIVFVTDRPPQSETYGVAWVACGSPINNAGFAGVIARGNKWTSLIRNYSGDDLNVRWRIAGRDWKTSAIPAGGMTEISGDFASGSLTLELEEDGFALDNTLPIIRPVGKALGVSTMKEPGFEEFSERIVQLAGAQDVSAKPDITLAAYSPLSPAMPLEAAIIFVKDDGARPRPLSGVVAAENHPLIDGLSWQGLLANDSFGVPAKPGDQVLLWQGRRPLIFLRGSQLVFNFDPRSSNAARLAAFPILLHRFFEENRNAKVAYEARNVDAAQNLSIAGGGVSSAPTLAGFFSVKAKDGTTLFDGAAQFSDARESDFRLAQTASGGESAMVAARELNAQGGFLDPLWGILLGALMIGNWSALGTPLRRGA